MLDTFANLLPGTVVADLALGPPVNAPSPTEYNALLFGAVIGYVLVSVLQARPPSLGSGRGGRQSRLQTLATPTQNWLRPQNVLAGCSLYWASRLAGNAKTISTAVGAVAGYAMYKYGQKKNRYTSGDGSDTSLKRWLNDGRVTPAEVTFMTKQPLPEAGAFF